jgi:hypothetical protein
VPKHHVKKVNKRHGYKAENIFNFSTRWKTVVTIIFWPLSSQGNRPQYLLVRRTGGPQSQFGKNDLPLLEIQCWSSSLWPVIIQIQASNLTIN